MIQGFIYDFGEICHYLLFCKKVQRGVLFQYQTKTFSNFEISSIQEIESLFNKIANKQTNSSQIDVTNMTKT